MGVRVDSHKPGPAHSWRAFLIEIGTIVFGILVALGLQQWVDAARTDHEVAQARAALHREMAQDLAVAATWRRVHPCWLGAVEAAKAWGAAGGDRPSLPSGLMRSYQSSVWEMTRAGPVTQMPLDEQLALARFYDQVGTDVAVINNHRSMATEIGGYLERERLTPTEAGDLARLAGRLRWTSNVEFENAQQVLAEGAQLKLTPAAPDRAFEARIDAFCRTFAPPR